MNERQREVGEGRDICIIMYVPIDLLLPLIVRTDRYFKSSDVKGVPEVLT